MDAKNNRIIQIRKELSMTQEKFAKAVDASAATIRNIEQGKGKLSADIAIQIHDKLGYSLDYIYGLCEDAKDTAGTMLLYLEKLFDYRVDPGCDKYPHILFIRKPVLDFLDGYARASQLYSGAVIPEPAYTLWVEKLKADFNSAMNADSECEEFCLIPKKDRDSFVKILERDKCDLIGRAIEQNKIKFTSAAAKRDFISRASKCVTVDGAELRGFDDFLKKQREDEPDQFFDEHQAQLEANRARFTTPNNNSTKNPTTQGLLEMFKK